MHLRRTVNKFQRPSILQLNIEGLTASKMSVLHYLALQCEALVILLQETHCTSVERLDLPSYHLAGFSLSRKHEIVSLALTHSLRKVAKIAIVGFLEVRNKKKKSITNMSEKQKTYSKKKQSKKRHA